MPRFDVAIVGAGSAGCALVRQLATRSDLRIALIEAGDYDRWGIQGWNDADLSPVVDELLRVLPAHVPRDDELVAWQRAFLDAAIVAGAPRRRGSIDPSGATGVGSFTQNIKDGIRWNAAFAFLDPVRSRVTVISDFLVDRFVFDGDRAQAVIGHGAAGTREVRADRFVLCAGVYGSSTPITNPAREGS